MKKILFIILSMFMLVGNVKAETYVNSYYSVTNKCAVVKDNKVVIPVTIYAGHDNVKLSNLIKENRLGYVDNFEDVLGLNIRGVNKDNMEVYVDYKRNSEGRSYILLNVDDNLELKTHEELVKFNVEVEILNDAQINKMNVLGNEVVLGDEKTCEDINGFKIDEVEIIKYVDLSKADHGEYFEDLFTGVIVGLLSVSLIICLVILFRLKKNIKSLKK